MLNSSYTGRAPRDLESAFGPYIRSSNAQIVPMPDPVPFQREDWIVMSACAVAVFVLLVIFSCEWWLA